MIFIFDVDGTLVDSIKDVAESANRALTECGFPARTLETYKGLMGLPVAEFTKRLLPPDASESDLKRVLSAYRETHVYTEPYDGIEELLSELYSRGDKIACLSNKPQSSTKELINRLFGSYVSLALGSCEQRNNKPSAEGVDEILHGLNETRDNAVFIGDTATDIKTAKNAGIKSVFVKWGFGREEDVAPLDPDHIISAPDELLKIFV